MDLVHDVNLERLLWCSRDRGLAPDDLARVTKIRADKIASVFRGEAFLTVAELQKIADYFGRGILFFLERGPVEEREIRTAGFRTLTNEYPDLDPETKSLIERVERQREIFLGLRDEDDDEIQPFNPPLIDSTDIAESASKVKNWLGKIVDNSFTGYRAAIQSQGILVFRSNGYAGKWQVAGESSICGFSILHQVYPIIFVRKQESESRQLFTLIHELAHLLLHRSSFADKDSDLAYKYKGIGTEAEANAFAGVLLVPQSALSKIQVGSRPADVSGFDAWLRPHARTLGVSPEVVLRQLVESGGIGRTEYRAYREWKASVPKASGGRGSREWRHREPVHLFGETFVKTVLDALHSRQITLNKASSYLDNLKVSDIHKLENYVNEAF